MRCVLSGYYGLGNAGDEAILAAILAELNRQARGVIPVVLSADPDHTRRTHGVPAVSRTSLRQVLAVLRRAQLLISGGGGLLQDVTGSRTVPYYAGIVLLARLLRVPVFFYAQGVGPLERRLSRRLAVLAARTARGISVRDPESAALLAELGLPAESVQVTADPVLGLDPWHPAAPTAWEGFWRKLGGRPAGPAVGVAVHGSMGAAGTRGLAEALAEALGAAGAHAVVFALHPARDGEAAQELGWRLGGRAVTAARWDEPVPPAAWPAVFSRLDAWVSVRLHGALFGARAGVPGVALAYDGKVDAAAARLGLPVLPVAALAGRGGPSRLARELAGLLAHRDELREPLLRRAEALSRQARATAGLALACARRDGGD